MATMHTRSQIFLLWSKLTLYDSKARQGLGSALHSARLQLVWQG